MNRELDQVDSLHLYSGVELDPWTARLLVWNSLIIIS